MSAKLNLFVQQALDHLLGITSFQLVETNNSKRKIVEEKIMELVTRLPGPPITTSNQPGVLSGPISPNHHILSPISIHLRVSPCKVPHITHLDYCKYSVCRN